MSDKIVLITGAKGGLGTAVTETFLDAGAIVIGASRSIEDSDFPRPNFRALPVDFTKPQSVEPAIRSIIERHGRLDMLIHILGGFAGGQSIDQTSDETWHQMLDLNLNSAFYLVRKAIPHLRKSAHGRLIAIGSLAARQPQRNLGAYVVSKAALATLVQTVALENADSALTANVILPGTIDTAANRKSMPGADFSAWVPPRNIAELVLWLADEQASHVNGAAISIEGKHA